MTRATSDPANRADLRHAIRAPELRPSLRAPLSKAGVRYIKVHDTRRTCASLLVALDVHPRVAMQILRHTQINITMAVYSEVPSATTRNALKRLGRHVDA